MSKLTHAKFQGNWTTSIFRAWSMFRAWMADDVIFAKNRHRHRTRQVTKHVRANFHVIWTISIFRAWSNFRAWQGDDVILAKSQHRHRTRQVSKHTRANFHVIRTSSIFQFFCAAGEILGRGRWAWPGVTRLRNIPDILDIPDIPG